MTEEKKTQNNTKQNTNNKTINNKKAVKPKHLQSVKWVLYNISDT